VPPLPSAPNVLKVTLKWSYSADADVLSRFYLLYAGAAPTSAGLATMGTAIGTAYSSDLASFANTDVTLDDVSIEDLTSPTSAAATVAAVVAGTRTGDTLSAGTAVLVNYTIKRRYRGGKPRAYLPFFSASDLGAATAWAGGSVTGLETAWTTFMAAVFAAAPAGTSISAQVNVSYYDGFTLVTSPTTGRGRNVAKLRAGGPVIDTVTATAVNIKPASQRRRNLHKS
jgi:hypothetical protein